MLRQLGVGCHVGGWWYGAVCYADDMMLLAPSRTAAVMMLECCEKYAAEHNLKFSTDPLPSKSKSKCIYFCGKLTRLTKPDNLKLLGKDLPKKEILTPKKIWRPPLAPWGAIFSFFLKILEGGQ